MARTCRVGVHGRNDVEFYEADYNAIRTAKIETIKMMSQTRLDHFIRLRAENPNVEFITRLYDGPNFGVHGHPNPDDFARRMIPVMNQLRSYCVKFEIHNEPNHMDRIEGWGDRDEDARDFNTWFLRAYTILKQQCPWAQLGFPGLAIPHRDIEWIDLCRPAIQQADWLGVHCYWQTPAGQENNHLVNMWGLRFKYYHERFPDKIIELTEVGNSNVQDKIPFTEESHAREYTEYLTECFKYPYLNSACWFILSSADPAWDGFAWRSENGRLHQVVQAVGQLTRPTLIPAQASQTAVSPTASVAAAGSMPVPPAPVLATPPTPVNPTTTFATPPAPAIPATPTSVPVTSSQVDLQGQNVQLQSQLQQLLAQATQLQSQLDQLRSQNTQLLSQLQQLPGGSTGVTSPALGATPAPSSGLTPPPAPGFGAVQPSGPLAAPTRPAPPIQNIINQLKHSPTLQFPTRPLSQIDRIVIHHTAVPPTVGAERIAIHRVDSQGWPGIGYHYFITGDGQIQQTNELTTQSTHAGQYDPVAVGIAFAGDFTSAVPSPAQLDAGAQLIAWLLSQLNLSIGAVYGYKELVVTQSPGAQWDSGARWGDQLRQRIQDYQAGVV